MSFVEGDLLEPFKAHGGNRLDMIVSNPPYVSAREWAELPDEVREREPRLALYGGEDGFGLIDRLIADAPRCLAPGGCRTRAQLFVSVTWTSVVESSSVPHGGLAPLTRCVSNGCPPWE